MYFPKYCIDFYNNSCREGVLCLAVPLFKKAFGHLKQGEWLIYTVNVNSISFLLFFLLFRVIFFVSFWMKTIYFVNQNGVRRFAHRDQDLYCIYAVLFSFFSCCLENMENIEYNEVGIFIHDNFCYLIKNYM